MCFPLRGGLSRDGAEAPSFFLLATVSRSRRCVVLRADGRGASAKHAVNPSMGARSAHPCASRFCAGPTPIRFKHCLRLLVPPGSREKKDQIQIQEQMPMLLLLLLPLLPPWGSMRPRPQEIVGGRPGGPGRTVGAMDGAIEPPWMGLRRVLTTHTAPPSHGMHAVAVASAVASTLRRVQGAALPNPLKCLWEPVRTARRSAC